MRYGAGKRLIASPPGLRGAGRTVSFGRGGVRRSVAAAAWRIGRRLDEPLLQGVLGFRTGLRGALLPYTASAEKPTASRARGAVVYSLSRDKSQLEAVLNQMSEAVLAVYSSGAALVVNPSLCRLLSVDATAALGRPYLECVRHNAIS